MVTGYRLNMSGAISAILFACAVLVAAEAAHAHSPYFTQTEKIALPDGATGQIRLLHGDGIILKDPMRAIILDARGRPLARSQWSFSMLIACERDNRCRVYDFDRLWLYEPNSDAFRVEPSLELGSEHYSFVQPQGHGFAERRMSMTDLARSFVAYSTYHWLAATLAAVTSAFAIAIALFAYGSAVRKMALGTAIHYFLLAMLVVLFLPLLGLTSLGTMFFAGMPILLWLMLSSAGAAASGFLFYSLRRVAARSAMA